MLGRPSSALVSLLPLALAASCAAGGPPGPRTAAGRVSETAPELPGAVDETALLDGAAAPRPGPGAVELDFVEIPVRRWQPPAAAAAAAAGGPCALVTAAEFEAWAGAPAAGGPLVLEDGEACGFVTADGGARMAVGFVPLAERGPRSMPSGRPTESVAGLPARWAQGWPLAGSGALVVAAPGFDLIVEMSSTGRFDDGALRGAAARFASSAWDRLR